MAWPLGERGLSYGQNSGPADSGPRGRSQSPCPPAAGASRPAPPSLALPGAMSEASSADVGAEHGNVPPGGVKRYGPLLPRRWGRGCLRVPGEQAQRGGSEATHEEEILAALSEENEVNETAVANARAQWEWFVNAEPESEPAEEEVGDDVEANDVDVAAWRREVEERAARRAQQQVEQERGEGVSPVTEGPRAGPESS